MRRTRDEALETRDRILDGAERIFMEKGVAGASLADIADAAGVTRGAIYGHFANKADVLAAMVARVRQPLDALFDAADDPEAPDPLGVLRAALASCLRELAVDPRTRRVFTVLLTDREPGPADWHPQRDGVSGAHARGRLGRMVRNVIAHGQLPARLDAKLAAAMLTAALRGIMRDWLLDPTAFALPRDASRLADALLEPLQFSVALQKRTAAARQRRRAGAAAA